MSELGDLLASLGLEQYHDAFISEGFDSWETVQDITEQDLDTLNVKLGHRRKLQRYIASTRGVTLDQPLSSPFDAGVDKGGEGTSAIQNEGPGERHTGGSDTKRKYRRHPKADENAPERPPSAYVLFSNTIREEIRGQDLSFTDIAKLVGARWQALSTAEREPHESRAAALKESFNQSLAEYKKSDKYMEYMQYLNDFKAKHGGGTSEGKRPKLEEEASGGSNESPIVPSLSSFGKSPDYAGSTGPSSTASTSTHARVGSMTSMASLPRASLDSPTSGVGATLPQGSASIGRLYSGPSQMETHPSSASRARDTTYQSTHSAPLQTPSESASRGGYFDQSSRPPISHDAPYSAGAPHGSSDSNMLRRIIKPSLSHQDTATSSSSVPSTLSYGSGSTGPLHTPLTPHDEPWTPRQSLDTPAGQNPSWDVLPRPIHPPLPSHAVSQYTNLSSLKGPDRSFFSQESSLRSLPPPTPSPSHDVHSLSIRPQSRTPIPFSEPRRSPAGSLDQDKERPIPERSANESTSSLDVLAYAFDAHRRDRPQD